MENELNKRLFTFAAETIKYLKTFERSIEINVIKHQLIKSVTSTAANYEESQAASSKQDFKNKVNISLREMRETNFWFRLLKETYNCDNKIERFIKESEELKRILGAISNKVRKET